MVLAALVLAAMPRWYVSHALLRIADAQNASAPAGSDAAAAATLAAAQLVASPQVAAPVVARLRLARTPEFARHRRLRALLNSSRAAGAIVAAWGRAIAAAASAPLRPAYRSHAPLHQLSGPRPTPLAQRQTLPAAAATAEAAIVAMTLSRLQVHAHAHSDLLDLQYRDHDPRLAAGILNAMSQELRAQSEARAARTLQRRRQFLATQLAAVNTQWQAAAQALMAFRATHPADAAGPGQATARARRLALSQALTQAEIDLWRQRAAVAAGRHPGPGRSQLDPGAQKRLANLRLQQARLAEQVSRLAAQYGPTALPLVQARRALASVRSSLRRYRRAILSGHQVAARADAWEQTRLQIAVRREAALLAAAEANAAQDEVLAARAQAQRDLYQQLWNRRRQLAIDQGLVRQAVQILVPARLPTEPARLPWVLALAAAGLVGWLLGLAAAWTLEEFAPRLRLDTAETLGLPLLGRLPLAPHQGWVRGLDDLWMTLLLAAGSDTTILFTSARPQEGKTAIVQGLGERLSHAGHSVLLLDCHFASPRLTVEWAAQPTPGLAEYLEGRCPLEMLLHHALAASGPAVVPTGQWRPALTGALASPVFLRLLDQLARRFDWVLLDAGPVDSQPEVRLLAHATDATLLVAAEGVTPLHAAWEAVQTLRFGAAKKLALVLNAAPATAARAPIAPATATGRQAPAPAAHAHAAGA